jgi:phosphatidylglycerol:prolipoprotein diacylglycerol transferase
VLPKLFTIGNFNMPTYGLLVASGVLLGLWISVRNSEKQGINPEYAWNLGIYVVLAGIIGSKVLYIINEWHTLGHINEIFSFSTLQAGGVFSGGLLAGLAVAIWYIRRHNIPALTACDAFSPGLALGHAIGRLGCFAAGCCFGKETHHFWGVTFTDQLANSISGTPLGKPLQPTQLFEAAVELANFFVLTWMLKRKRFDGQVFGAFLILYGTARFFLEFLRGDPGRGEIIPGVLSGTQLIAIFLVLGGGIIWWWKSSSRPVLHPATR